MKYMANQPPYIVHMWLNIYVKCMQDSTITFLAWTFFSFPFYNTGWQMGSQSLLDKNFSNESIALCLGKISYTTLITVVCSNFKNLLQFPQLLCPNYFSWSSKPNWAFGRNLAGDYLMETFDHLPLNVLRWRDLMSTC